MSYAVGALVRARGREWVVLPETSDDLLMVRPLGGTDDEVTGIYLPLEGKAVTSATFALPDPEQAGDYRSSRLLRDAVRLGFRSSAGPFRSFGHLGVDPRPYQLVPLLMALKLDPVRLLIADDVGIGKTIEAALVARELLDRGEVRRLAVLCPPPLTEQWQAELREKFHLSAEVVLPGTVARLERDLAPGESLFERYHSVIVSTDFIKSERRRAEFLRTCPELVIVDEAHTCAVGGPARGSQHQRHQLVADLARRPDRHLLLVTATPHSGNEDAFRSLLALLDPDFAVLPAELGGEQHRADRQRLAAHMVQRRRADIRAYLDTTTVFPEREELPDQGYKLTPAYHALLDQVLRYARESVATSEAARPRYRQRIRWWSALALLRAIASSPAAAAATLRTRAATADTTLDDEVDEIGRRTVLDLGDDSSLEGMDVAPGADDGDATRDAETRGDPGDDQRPHHARLLRLAQAAEALQGAEDAKLQRAVALVRSLVREGFNPIVFCRFIPTAEYVKDALSRDLPKDMALAAVTGLLPPAEREARVAALGEAERRVLVCTDCLSEGINLQDAFDAVVHYDLSWNPTRHEQREGRVDRYGQPSPKIRVVTLYGLDNQIDGLVLDVLLRKHRAIRGKLGISVPVPADTNQVIEAIFEGLLLLERQGAGEVAQARLPGLEAYWKPKAEAIYGEWEATAERERRSRTLFAQDAIKPQEVAAELAAMRHATGSSAEVATFVRGALRAYGGTVSDGPLAQVDPRETPQALRDAIGTGDPLAARFELPVRDGERYLSRTDPLVEGLAAYVMDAALDAQGDGQAVRARRCGVIRTATVRERTTLLLLRLRYHLVTQLPGAPEAALLAEECQLAGFTGVPDQARWLPPEATETLLAATPDQNVPPDIAANFLRRAIDGFAPLMPALEALARDRAAALLAAHRRVRAAARLRGVEQHVEPQLPPDVLGVYIYLPVIGGA